MAKIKVVHKAAILSTELSVKEIKRLEAISPDALCVKNEDGEVLFQVATGSVASISKYGICFSEDSKISVLISSKGAVNKDTIEELFGAALLQLATVERQAAEVLEEVDADLDDMIEIETLED